MYSIVLLVLMFALLYFFMIRPENKRKKKAQEMRDSLKKGDTITTIGGIVGRVLSIKEDTVLFETGSDRTKLRVKKWAVQEVEKLTRAGFLPATLGERVLRWETAAVLCLGLHWWKRQLGGE